ncbi:MAG TPA: phasin family protein [Telluria sp.]|nr:phasin family protein [Telluria sp.]
MFTSPEQFAAATKTLFELQMNTFNALASKTVQGVEQVVNLNMTTARNMVDSSIAGGKEISQASTPQQAMSTAAAQAQPGMQSAVTYGQDLKQIIDEIHNEFTSAADAHLVEAKNALSALIYDVTQNVKPGSENAVLIVKAAIDNAFRGYEQVTHATRDAVKQVEDQIAKATEKVVKAPKAKS